MKGRRLYDCKGIDLMSRAVTRVGVKWRRYVRCRASVNGCTEVPIGGDRNVLKLHSGDGYLSYVNMPRRSVVYFK